MAFQVSSGLRFQRDDFRISGETLDTYRAAIINDELYFNMHSAAFPGGEIRGQLSVDFANGPNSVVFEAVLDGGQEVPANDSEATGVGQLIATTAGDSIDLAVDVVVTGLTLEPASLFHIHTAPAGSNGGVLLNLDPDGALRSDDPGDLAAAGFSAINVVTGTNAAETYIGDGLSDLVEGRGRADTIEGRGGDDELDGGGGGDNLNGGAGNDILDGGAGRDTLQGGAGADDLNGGGANDLVQGGAGADTARGLGGNDTVDGGAGADSLMGDGGDDLLRGGAGADELFGANGADTLNGGGGADLLLGAVGDDLLIGGKGADTLIGGLDADEIRTGTGSDIVGFDLTGAGLPGTDSVTDFSAANDQFAFIDESMATRFNKVDTSDAGASLKARANVVVLTDAAISLEDAMDFILAQGGQSREGVVIFNDDVLGVPVLARTEDLSDAGVVPTILAELDAGLDLADLRARNFDFVTEDLLGL